MRPGNPPLPEDIHNRLHKWSGRFRPILLAMILVVLWGASAPPTFPCRSSVLAASNQSSEEVLLKGRLEPRQFVQLAFSQAGRIKEITVREGDTVEAGAMLVRLDGYEARVAEVDAARLEKILAQQALDDLYRNHSLALATITADLRQAERERALARDRLRSLQKPKEEWIIQQAKANLLLAENRLSQVREDVRRAQHQYSQQNDILWKFVDRHQYKLFLTLLEKRLAYAERRYWDAQEKYADLIAPPDAIDLALAQARLAVAEARVHQLERERTKLLDGPNPDELEVARARLRAAEARLAASESALHMSELVAPISGVVVQLNARKGERVLPAQPLVVIADLSAWVVQTQDLKQDNVVNLYVGQPVNLSLDAFPGVALQGAVESISLYYQEEDEDIFYTARISLEQPAVPIRWGMTARIRLPGR